ncbi:MAG: DUF1592 domain-containing protein [Lentisphaerales bacterium]|nr:DUF1592 domain-containing protein [Lentisphaerales bacterium]
MNKKVNSKVAAKKKIRTGSLSKSSLQTKRKRKKSFNPFPIILLLILLCGSYFAYEPIKQQLSKENVKVAVIAETPEEIEPQVIVKEKPVIPEEDLSFQEKWQAGKVELIAFDSSKEDRFTTFNHTVKPLLEKHCSRCHGEEKTKGDIDLTIYDSAQKLLEDSADFLVMKDTLINEDMPPKPKKTGFTEEDRIVLLSWIAEYVEKKDYSDPVFQDPGPSVIRQLTTYEYNRTIKSLLGIKFDVSKEVGIKKESNVKAFSNLAATMQMSPLLIEKYFTASDKIIAKLLFDSGAMKALFKKHKKATNAEAAKFLKTFMAKAYRRPVKAGEVKKIYTLYLYLRKQKKSFSEALVRSLKPIFVSPFFLNRIEQNQAPENSKEAYRISDLELANRLSYFLWSTMPDDELIRTAVGKKLSDPNEYKTQIARMLKDKQSKALVHHFMEEWLEFGKVKNALPSTRTYPTFNIKVKNSMFTETEYFINEIIEKDLSVVNFIDSDFTFMNKILAKHYGIPEEVGYRFQKVDLKPEYNRGGLLGMGSMLAMTSHTNRTKPTDRGRWVAEVMLGTKIPDPPADVEGLQESKTGAAPQNFREKLNLHVADAACAVCHKKMDPLGFALDNYNAVGQWREDERGQPLDVSGVLPDGQKVNGAKELKQILLAQKDKFVTNLFSKMLSFAIGRNLQYYDELTVKTAVENIKKADYKFSALVMEVVNSRPFLYRKNIENYYASNESTEK